MIRGRFSVDIRRHHLLWGSLLVGSLAISIAAWLLFKPEYKAVVLFYPAAENSRLESELHYIPWGGGEPDRIRHAVRALAQGPLSMNYRRIMPQSTGVLGVFIEGKNLYVNFSSAIQSLDPLCPLTPKDRISAVIRSLKFNFPYLNSVKIMIEGQELGAARPYLARKS